MNDKEDLSIEDSGRLMDGLNGPAPQGNGKILFGGEMTNNERIFRLLGWDFNRAASKFCVDFWLAPDDPAVHNKLPNVSNSYELCRKYIIPEMRERGYSWTAIVYQFSDRVTSDFHFEWWHETKTTVYEADIKDDNIASALVEAAIEVLEGEAKCSTP